MTAARRHYARNPSSTYPLCRGLHGMPTTRDRQSVTCLACLHLLDRGMARDTLNLARNRAYRRAYRQLRHQYEEEFQALYQKELTTLRTQESRDAKPEGETL